MVGIFIFKTFDQLEIYNIHQRKQKTSDQIKLTWLKLLQLQKYMKRQFLINSKNGSWEIDLQFAIFKNRYKLDSYNHRVSLISYTGVIKKITKILNNRFWTGSCHDMLTDVDPYTIEQKHLDYVWQWIVYSGLDRLNRSLYWGTTQIRAAQLRKSQLLIKRMDESYNQYNQDFLWSGAKNKITKRGRHQIKCLNALEFFRRAWVTLFPESIFLGLS